jgi:hypothetical protein
MGKYRTQGFTDYARGGVGVELFDSRDRVLAEVFRSDRDRTVTVRSFRKKLPAEGREWLYARAQVVLDPFEDGTPLSEAVKCPAWLRGGGRRRSRKATR